MDDLAEYHSDKEEIIRLNNQANLLAGFYHKFYKDQIEKLTNIAKRHREARYQEKRKNEKLVKSSLSVVKALLILKHKNIIDLTLIDIAKESFIDVSVVYKANKELGFL